jgi:hypothetical protein
MPILFGLPTQNQCFGSLARRSKKENLFNTWKSRGAGVNVRFKFLWETFLLLERRKVTKARRRDFDFPPNLLKTALGSA